LLLKRALGDDTHLLRNGCGGTGTPYELVARQLGHTYGQVLARVYARFAATHDRWEKIVAPQDQLDQAAARG